MIKIKHTLLYMVAVVAYVLTGCSDDLFNGDYSQHDSNCIQLSGDIDQLAVTRVNDNGFCNGDVMGVYIVDYEGNNPGTLKVSGNRGDNVRHTFDEPNYKWNSAYDLFWKDKHTHIDVYGYYPYANPESIEDYQFEVQKDQSTATEDGEMGGYEASDFLWGKVSDVAPTTSVIRLPLAHRMSNARVTLIQGSGFADGEWAKTKKIVLTANVARKSSINLSTGEIKTAGSVENNMTIPSRTNDEWRTIVVPQTVAAGRTLFSITIGGVPYKFTKNEALTYVSGKMMNFGIKVDKQTGSGTYKLTLVSESITPWENDLVSHDATAKEYVVINSTKGHLKDAIIAANKDYTKLKNLKITGEIGPTDFEFMRDEMSNLQSLNMKETIVYGRFGYQPWISGDNSHDGVERKYVIHERAFDEKNTLVRVVLPDSLTGIGERAFRDCVNLTGSINIPEGVTRIGPSAFLWCNSLTGSLSLPTTLEYIGGGGAVDIGGAFDGCHFNCELKLPNNLKYIGHNVFASNPGYYGNLVLPDKLEYIGDGAFCNDNNLTGSLKIPQGVKAINQNAFGGTGFNGTLQLHDGLTSINQGAFSGVPLKGELNLPKSLTSVGESAFNGCDFSGELKLPKGLISIGRNAFAGNWRLMGTLEFPDGLESIGAGAFANCRSIEQLIFPESLSSIGYEPTWGDNGGAFANDFGAEGEWEVASKPDWCEVSPASGNKKTEVILTIKGMAKTTDRREGKVVFRLKDKDYTHECSVSQYGYEYGEDEWITLQKATKGNKGGINIVLLGDGFNAKDIASGEYLKDIKQEVEYFFGIEPYKTYRDYFNVYTAIPLSTESGVGTVNTIRYNRFNTTFTGGVGLKADYDEIFDYALGAPTVNKRNLNQTLIIIVPNSTDYGGICQMWPDGSAIAFCPKSTYGYPLNTRGVIQHEAGGHGFGKLGDEYIYHNAFIDACGCSCCGHVLEFNAAKSLGWYDNLELNGKMHSVGWSHLIFDDRYSDIVDIYEGGYMHNRGVFRSEPNSCMNNDIPYYSTISRESIVKRIKAYAGETYSFEDFVKNDKRDAGIVESRAFGGNGDQRNAGTYQHAPVIHKGSPLKMAKVRKHR